MTFNTESKNSRSHALRGNAYGNWRMTMEKKYEIIIFWSSEDNAYIAEVPELPGCMADGKTYQEALANVEQIIEEWIETATKLGRPIPQPRGRLAYA